MGGTENGKHPVWSGACPSHVSIPLPRDGAEPGIQDGRSLAASSSAELPWTVAPAQKRQRQWTLHLPNSDREASPDSKDSFYVFKDLNVLTSCPKLEGGLMICQRRENTFKTAGSKVTRT